VRLRIQLLLEMHKSRDRETERVVKAVRAPEYAGGPAARKCLEELARASEGSRVAAAAQAALRRLEAAPPR
jgi:hypothetical protein